MSEGTQQNTVHELELGETNVNGFQPIGSNSSEGDKPSGGSSMSKGRIAAIVIAVIVVVALALGLGLGLGLNKSEEEVVTTTTTSTTTTSTTTTPTPTPTTAPRPPGCYDKMQFPPGAHLPSVEWSGECPLKASPQCPPGVSEPPVVLISLDGFRADYMLRNFTPTLRRISDCGVHAKYMRASFPTKTYSNHYTLATGLYPESHGIIDNFMYDLEMHEEFRTTLPSKFNKAWYQGEPIWNTIMKTGKKVLNFFWAGSDVDIQDMYSDVCYNYNGSVPYKDRVNEILGHFSGSPEDYPSFVSLYFDQPDTAGHILGPYGSLVNGNLTIVDNMINMLLAGLEEKHMAKCVNFIVLADHGMQGQSCKRVVKISDYMTAEERSQVYVRTGAFGRINGKYMYNYTFRGISENPDGPEPEEILDKMECKFYNETKDWATKVESKYDLPKRYHYMNNHRIDDVVLDVDDEWIVYINPCGSSYDTGGEHGYDNTYKSMHAIFTAFGPSFQQDLETEPFDSIEIYNLIAELTNLSNPAPNNGTNGRLHHLLANPGPFPTEAPPRGSYSQCPFPDDVEADLRRNSSSCSCDNLESHTNKSVEELDKQLDLDAEAIKASQDRNLPLGMPELDFDDASVCELTQTDYISGYNHEYKMPVWTSFRMSAVPGASILNEGNYRTDKEIPACVRPDVRLSRDLRAECQDYIDDNINLSHAFLYPPSLSETSDNRLDGYITSNLVPMYSGFRSGVWQEWLYLLEEYAEKYGDLQVTLGPIFDYNGDGLRDEIQDINKFVKNGSVPVPTHYYGVAARCEINTDDPATCKPLQLIAVIFPHKPAPRSCWPGNRKFQYQQWNVAKLQDIELLTNLRYWPNQSALTALEQLKQRTYLPVGLWKKTSWTDLFDENGKCPAMDEAQCHDGMDPEHPPLLLISLDGFRPDYLDRGLTPTIQKLVDCGVSTPYMRSIYPSLTFPNHYSQVTGLYAESHGIVDNNMYDMKIRSSFSLGSPNASDPRWWGGEPMWNTVEKQDKVAMTYLWPGSDAPIEGMRPTEWVAYNGDLVYDLRVDSVLAWLNKYSGQYPDFMTLYFSRVDDDGHDAGPWSKTVDYALELMDGYILQLMDGLYRQKLHKCVNIIIVSDHGMSDIACERDIPVDDYLPSGMLNKVYMYSGPAGRISYKYKRSGSDYIHIPDNEQESKDAIIRDLSCKHTQMDVFDKTLFAKRNHFVFNDRIDDILMRPVDRWTVNRYSPWCGMVGNHGWDNFYSTMRAFFTAYGPSFAQQLQTDSFENIELYNMMTNLLNVTAAPNNGTEGRMHHMLRKPPALPASKASDSYVECHYPITDDDYDTRANITVTECVCDVPENTTVRIWDERLNMATDDQRMLEELHVPHGLPRFFGHNDSCVLHQAEYVAAYSEEHKMALWSAFTLNASQFSDVTYSCMRPDVRLQSHQQPHCSDYVDQENFIQAFLYPNALSRNEESAMDLRILSNTVPMYRNFETGVWQHLLDMLKGWAQKYVLHVVMGPLFDYNSDGLRDQSLTNLLNDKIPIPSHYYAIVMRCPEYSACSHNGNYTVQSFVLPHINTTTNCMTEHEYLIDNVARMRDIELLSDLEFFTSASGYPTLEGIFARTFIPIDLWQM